MAAERSYSYAVETSGLSKRFGDRTVVRDVELYVPRGVAFEDEPEGRVARSGGRYSDSAAGA
jgi:hypothetical protein